ncbi:MAG: tetratricopeptide repeat protein, partial [Candidatus Helarchaeota archaeon]
NFIMANILFEKESYPLALKYVNKSIILNTNCQSCFLLKGIILHHMDKFQESNKNFDKVLEKFGPDIRALAHKSLVLFRLNQLDSALDLSESVLSISENNLFALINKGLILAKKQQYNDAIKTFEKYASRRRDIRILTHLKNCYKKMGDIKKEQEYQKEIKELKAQKKKRIEKEKKPE